MTPPLKNGGKVKLLFKRLKTKKMLRTSPQIFMLAFHKSKTGGNNGKSKSIY